VSRTVSKKVYCVHSAIAATDNENELLNWAKYTLVAPDAELAISFAKVRFTQKGEYAYEVEFITELDLEEVPVKKSKK
jgi:hypothetical protein